MPTLTLPKPHAAQQHVIDTAKRFNVVCCGRRWGKSELGMDRLIQPALHGKQVAWFAPNYRLLSDVWREIQSRLLPITRDISQQERRLELQGGGSLEMWSLDSPDAGRGRSYSLVTVDEAALVVNLEAAWQESIRPMLTDHRGSAWFLSTPKGTANYFHQLYQRGQDPNSTDWKSWQMPTGANPYIDPAEIISAKSDLTDLAYAQEYAASFASWSGAVFRRILDAVAEPPENGIAVMIGVDWGRTSDFTVFTAISATGQVLAIDRFRGLEYSLQRARLAAFRDRLGGRCWIVAESNSMGGPVVEQLQRDGLPVAAFTTTNSSKAAIIENLALAFERGTIRIPSDPILIGELQAFESRPLPSGMMRYSAPDGLHDDCVMSLAIAWSAWLAPQQQPTTRTVFWNAELGGFSEQPAVSSVEEDFNRALTGWM